MKGSQVFAVFAALSVGVVFGYFVGKGGMGRETSGSGSGGVGRPPSSGELSALGRDAGSRRAADDDDVDAPGEGGGAADELALRALRLLEEGDVEAALKEVFDAPGQMERMEALLRLVRDLDAGGIEAALAKVRGMPRGMDMFMSASLLMARYAEISPEKALAFASSSSGFERMMGTASVLRTWAAKDPRAAGAYLVGTVLEEGGDEWQLRRTAASVASEWSRQDPEAALAWAKGLPESVRGEALETVIERITTDDPQRAAAVALALPAEDRVDALRSIADQWSRTAPEEATAWANALEGDERAGALEEALQGWAYNDPDGATAFLANISDAEERDGLVPDVASRWARRGAESAADAARWLAEQEDGDGKVRATGEVVGTWMRSDPAAASTWLGEQPAGEAKDRGIVAMLEGRELREQPEIAVAWADTISDEKLRGDTVYSSTLRWLADDREAALDYISSSGSLSEVQKAELVEMTPEQLRQARARGGRRRF